MGLGVLGRPMWRNRPFARLVVGIDRDGAVEEEAFAIVRICRYRCSRGRVVPGSTSWPSMACRYQYLGRGTRLVFQAEDRGQQGTVVETIV